MLVSLLFLQAAALAQPESSEDTVQATKLIACMQVTRQQLMEEKEMLSTLAEKSPFPKKDVLTKVMAQMIIGCINLIPLEECEAAILTKDDLPRHYLSYAPLPREPFLTADSVALTQDEELLVKDILEKSEQAKAMKAAPGQAASYEAEDMSKPMPAIGSSLGLFYVLVVFLLFAAFVLYGIKRLQDREAPKSDKRRKRA